MSALVEQYAVIEHKLDLDIIDACNYTILIIIIYYITHQQRRWVFSTITITKSDIITKLSHSYSAPDRILQYAQFDGFRTQCADRK